MNSLVRLLLRIYPPAWRREYGAELTHLLAQRRLTPNAVIDVLWNGVRQRVHDADPGVLLGVVTMLFVLAGVISNSAGWARPAGAIGGALRDSSMTLPSVTVAAFETSLYALTLMLCGCWTHLRSGARASKSGMAAVRVGAVAGIPVMAVGLLILAGVIHLRVIGPGDPLPYGGSGWTYTYFTSESHAPSWLAVFTAPLLRLPLAWVYGWIGGQMARVIVRRGHTGAFSSTQHRA
jgi:hypothetical protein